MSIGGLFAGTHAEICGVEPDPYGARVFVGPRYNGNYVLIEEPADVDMVLCQWSNTRARLTMPLDDAEAIGIRCEWWDELAPAVKAERELSWWYEAAACNVQRAEGTTP